MSTPIASTAGIGQLSAHQHLTQPQNTVKPIARDADGDNDASAAAAKPAAVPAIGAGSLINTQA